MSVMENLTQPQAALASTVVSGVYNALAARAQRSWSERMMDKQRQWQLDDWSRMNEYNSPGAVMARMSSAGLNPDLLMGQGVGGSSSQMPSQGSVPGGSEANPVDTSGFSRSAYSRLQREGMESQIKVNEALEDKYRSDAELNRSNAVLTGEKVLTEQSSRILAESLNEAKVREIDANVGLIEAKTNLTNEEVNQMSQMFDLNVRKMEEEINLMISQQGLNAAEARYFREQANKLVQETKELCETWVERKQMIGDEALKSARDEKLNFNEYVIAQAEQEARKYQAEWDRNHPKNANFRRIFTQYVNLNFGGSVNASPVSKIIKK